MKTIWKIAKAELNALFCSPIAWLILVIFAFQAGLTFCDSIADQLRYIALGYSPYNLTSNFLVGYRGMFSSIQDNLYLYIPLLTMGLMSREYSSGSIKLLYSSPITNSQIILGKYLSMIIYMLILTGILVIYFIFTACIVKNFDYSFALTGLLGIFLLVCAYAAIGLFMSALTEYQVVAAVGTLTILAILNFMNQVGQDIDFVRDLTYWLSLSGRSDNFLQGLLCSEDLLYFIIVITLFIILSILRLKFERTTLSKVYKVSNCVAICTITLLLGYVSSMPKFRYYYDATETKANTLTPPSQKVMAKLDGGLTLTTFVNLLDQNFSKGMPSNRNWEMKKFEDYIRFKPEMKMEYVYYYDKPFYNANIYSHYPNKTEKEIAQIMCDNYDYDMNMFMSPEEIKSLCAKKGISLQEEGNRFVYLFERENGQHSFLRIYEDNRRDPSETEITAALKKMVVKAPKVAFISGHGERDIYKGGERDYSAFAKNLTFRHSLINQGYDVIALDLKKDTLQTEIAADIDIIVVADVREPYTEEELYKINQFIKRGGSMVIACEPRRQNLMNPLVQELGITFMPGVVLEPVDGYEPDLLFLSPSNEAQEFSKGYYRVARYKDKIMMPGSVGLSFDAANSPFKAQTFLKTSQKGWSELQTTDFKDGKPEMNSDLGEKNDSVPVMMRLSRKVGEKNQIIYVFGDADCMANSELTASRIGVESSNFTLISESFRDLSDNEFPIDASRPRPSDDEMYIGHGALIWIQGFFIVLIPLLLIGIYVYLWWERRKK